MSKFYNKFNLNHLLIVNRLRPGKFNFKLHAFFSYILRMRKIPNSWARIQPAPDVSNTVYKSAPLYISMSRSKKKNR